MTVAAPRVLRRSAASVDDKEGSVLVQGYTLESRRIGFAWGPSTISQNSVCSWSERIPNSTPSRNM
jgi:hypothetical protein